MSLHRITYRPEVDGLRTLAVLSVIIYHAEFAFGGGKLLPGGFLGVDIFFVISGFLITSLIIKEVVDTGQFSLARFYERRARRLLPVLILVMFVSSYYAYKYLYAAQLLDFVKSVAASLTFVANIYWHVTLQEYGAESGAFKPFLHTWSLAVEEQFYLFFPLIFVFFLKRSQRKTALGMVAVLVLSLVSAQWATQYYSSFSFFQLPTRLWEMLAGSLLALRAHSNPNSSTILGFEKPWLNELAASLSVVLLLSSMTFIHLEDHHPGFVTAIPVFATAIYIAAAHRDQWVTKLLSSRPFVGIGLISYSLYLWHYPIFAFARIRGKLFYSAQDKLILIGATFVLAILGYYLVEKTFRNAKKVTGIPFVLVMLTSCVVLAIMLSSFVQSDGSQRRFDHLVKLYGDAQFDNHKLKEESVTLIQSRPEIARFKAESNKIKVVIIGNSHGKDFYNVFVQNMDLFSDFEFEYIGMGIGAHDHRFKQKVIDNPWFQQADIVLLSNRYMPRRKNYPGDLAVLGDFIDKIHGLGKTLVVLSNTVEFNDIEDKRVFDWYAQNSDYFNRIELKQLFYKQRSMDVEKRINRHVKKVALEKGAIFLEKSDFMCDHEAKTCDGVTDQGHKSFYDYGHYTLNGARYFGQKISDMGWFDVVHETIKSN